MTSDPVPLLAGQTAAAASVAVASAVVPAARPPTSVREQPSAEQEEE